MDSNNKSRIKSNHKSQLEHDNGNENQSNINVTHQNIKHDTKFINKNLAIPVSSMDQTEQNTLQPNTYNSTI